MSPSGSSPSSPTALVSRALLHVKLRSFGTLLFALGLISLVTLVGLAVVGVNPWGQVLLGVAASGLGLATFGTHSDTALAILRDTRHQAPLPEPVSQELDREFIFNRLALSELKATPITAWVMTLLALSALVAAGVAAIFPG